MTALSQASPLSEQSVADRTRRLAERIVSALPQHRARRLLRQVGKLPPWLPDDSDPLAREHRAVVVAFLLQHERFDARAWRMVEAAITADEVDLLPDVDQAIVWQLTIEHRSLTDTANAIGLDRYEVARRARDALRRVDTASRLACAALKEGRSHGIDILQRGRSGN